MADNCDYFFSKFAFLSPFRYNLLFFIPSITTGNVAFSTHNILFSFSKNNSIRKKKGFFIFLLRDALGGKVKRWDFYVRTNHDEVKKKREKI